MNELCPDCGCDVKVHETTRLMKMVNVEAQRFVYRCRSVKCLMQDDPACTKVWKEEPAAEPIFSTVPEPEELKAPEMDYKEFDPLLEDEVQRGTYVD